MVKALRINLFIIVLLLLCLTSCKSTLTPPLSPFQSSKKIEIEALLSDPLLKKDFREMKKIAIDARLVTREGNPYFTDADIKKLNAMTALLIQRLQQHYHLDPNKNKIHAFIGRNKYDSCYQYYNSMDSEMNGKDCHAFQSNFGSCDLCNQFIKTLRSRTKQIIHVEWYNHEKVSALVDTLILKNGDVVYMGLEFTPN
ncbi:MAG TPA: hypothetical protein VHM20_05250 [Gammaproteobacteria bacterium]|nr:hypothetical protein [Gammaproteobacteria bacterium]